MKTKIKAVFFDADGALIKSDISAYYLFKATLEKFGHKKKSKKEILKHFGLTTKRWIDKITPKLKKEELDEMRKWAVDKYAKHYMKRFAKPMKDSTEVLKELKKRKIKIALVTNQRSLSAQTTMKIVKFDKFNTIITADKVKKPKPSPEGLKLAMKRLKLKRNEIIYIGDTMTDVRAGKAAGIKTFLLKHKYNENIRCKKINSLKEILEMV